MNKNKKILILKVLNNLIHIINLCIIKNKWKKIQVKIDKLIVINKEKENKSINLHFLKNKCLNVKIYNILI